MFARVHASPLALLGALTWLGALSLGCGGTPPVEDEGPNKANKADQVGSVTAEQADAKLQALVDTWLEQALQAHDVAALPARFSGAEVMAQISLFANQVSFVEGLDAALTSFIEDGSDLESPRGLLEEFGPPTRDRSEQVREYLRRNDCKLMLVHRESVSGGVAEDHFIGWAPEGGESIAENWAFELIVPALGDHSHWAIVKRARDAQGQIQVYNYGFN
jgi:hypothetical protein